jgi:Ser/Thr protein kinase RdoA (MazF antagonist)
MNYATIIRAFGFELQADSTPESISPFAPVFRIASAEGLWIVKRTQAPLSRAQAIAAWTRSLAALGVVAPAPGFGDNPRLFHTDDQEQVWVVYPFLQGSLYQGDAVQIRAAGDLLGKIHAAGTDQDFGLKQRETVVTIEAEEAEADTAQVLRFMQQAFPHSVEAARSHLQMQAQSYFHQARPRLAATTLPLTNCSWDYKAANLVYQEGRYWLTPTTGRASRVPMI